MLARVSYDVMAKPAAGIRGGMQFFRDHENDRVGGEEVLYTMMEQYPDVFRDAEAYRKAIHASVSRFLSPSWSLEDEHGYLAEANEEEVGKLSTSKDPYRVLRFAPFSAANPRKPG